MPSPTTRVPPSRTCASITTWATLVALLAWPAIDVSAQQPPGPAGADLVRARPAAPAPAPAPARPPAPAPTPVPAPRLPTQADRIAVGELLFHETRLSANARQSCASCHVPTQGHADPTGSFLPMGGLALNQQGLRSSPSLRYLNGNGAFRIDGPNRASGGFTWDGRANSRALQARAPLLAANEMANPHETAVVATVRTLPSFNDLRFAYQLGNTPNDAQVFAAVLQALADYQAGDPEYQPFSSKFDAVRGGRATFTAAEARGQAAFNDPRRGNCASCHTSGGPQPVFTNFQYFALGVPRNVSVATQNPAFFDLGLCGPNRTDLAARVDLCGLFKVPTLRNVARTAPYMHNARFATLEEVVGFYATRDTDPARWYPVVNGALQRFNDLPTQYHNNVTDRAPFGRRPGQAPALSVQDVADVVAFLRTLTDGFAP